MATAYDVEGIELDFTRHPYFFKPSEVDAGRDKMTEFVVTIRQRLNEIGERIFTLKRFFNTKCGISRKDDRIPPRLQFPLERGLTKNKIPKIDNMLGEYYNIRGWDTIGIPTSKKLTELKINHY